ncbi:putative alkaline phosphatase family protein [Rosellinia necatrix]|uniref:Putative alkaline phosphatase family protein n=1 Tax=Rosellinia necatrix TaxID=77044 RepID=A0A1W2TT44_ROSNE|nr:putative alkaline phosphatase family protein [Rosellinia necatrix]
MAARSWTIAALASIGLRFSTYFFLRWAAFPPLLPAIYTLFAIYATALVSNYFTRSGYELVDQVDLAIQEDVLNQDALREGETDEVIVKRAFSSKETRAVIKRSPNRLRTLLTGAPSPSSLLFTILTVLVNMACVAFVTDFVYAPTWYHPSHDLSFARVGYVSHSEAKLLIREPDQTKMPITVQLHTKDAQAPFDNPLWQEVGNVDLTTEDSDYTAVVTLPLTHSKQRTYQWVTSNNHSGEFTAAPKPGAMPELFDGKFTFLSTSCLVPRLPYNPLDHPLAFPGMKHLAQVLPTLGAQFMLFLGDFIYVDVPHQFGQTVESYRQKYRQVYASPDWPAIGQNLSWIHVLDDHEISNDWDQQSTGVYENAVDPWHHYQTSVNPPEAKRAGGAGLISRSGATYFSFTQGPASFFMLDTRTYRSSNSEPFDSVNKTMLGEAQLEDLTAWLLQPEPRGVKWKIVASSVPFTKNWRVNTGDTWGGFLVERRKILEVMWNAGNLGMGVVVLSGDRHEFGATAFPPPQDSQWPEDVTVHEFSVSPLNQFYSPIPTYMQTDDEDVKLQYINFGNSKFGSITMEKLSNERSSLKYTAYIDGSNAWNLTILSPDRIPPPPPPPPARTGGSFWDKLRGL